MNFAPSTQKSSTSGDLKRASVRGGVVTLTSQLASVGMHTCSTIVLARLLGPAEYGVISMVTAITAFAKLFRDLGLSSATIQKEKLTHEQLSTLYWVNVAAGTILTLIMTAASPLVARFYDRPELVWVTMAMSINFILGSLSTQQGALLTRQMRFGRKAVATLSGSAVALIVSIVMALKGFSYWSLVAGSVLGSLVTTVLLNSLSGWRPGLPVRGSGVRSMLKYGANITGFDVVNYFHRNLDNVLIGRVWGVEALGLYSKAYSLLMFPITNLRSPIVAVAFPGMSSLQSQPERFRSYYRQVTGLLALMSMPLVAYVYLAASPIIELTLGHQWLGAVPIFSVLAIVAFVQPPLSLIGMVNLSLGNGRRHLKQGVAYALVVSAGFVVGLPWGPLGVAISYAVTTYIFLVPLIHWTFRNTPIRPRDFWEVVARPGLSSLAAVTLAMYFNHGRDYASPTGEAMILLAVFTALFFAVYLLIPGGFQDLRGKYSLARLIKSSRRKA